jgi:8-oxo-dGTP pyrophosphatase MutT (NUDIX family)
MDYDYSYGVIPVWRDATQRQYLLIQHHAGHWAFPKGHAEGEETPIEAAHREFAEETGITACRILETPAFVEHYTFRKRSGHRVQKTVTYFLGLVDEPTVYPQEAEVADYAWGGAGETRQRCTFEEARRLLDQAEQYFTDNDASA